MGAGGGWRINHHRLAVGCREAISSRIERVSDGKSSK